MPREKTCFTCTLFKPSRGVLALIKRPFASLCSFKFCSLREVVEKRSPKQREYKSVRAVFWPLVSMHEEESDKLGDLPSLSATERSHEPFPSPATPTFIKMVRLRRSNSDDTDVQDPAVEAACRSFEGYLMEMLLEEHKMRDLKDVEDLIYCWDSLKSPVFVDLVCRFYGELCKDLFSDETESPTVDEKLH
ncbi:transcription repressor OFP17-like protein [Carex littledalei]|uniref:Transcription repressor OFP17-like protein n=1 Tax=Carex littledalei TaxID=544730 RepID=A0A833RCH8_9POAL|nr:transcription repressor OFP17-like protein [Carex littledalei]